VAFRPSIPYGTTPVAVLTRSRSTLVTPRLQPFGTIWAPLRTVDRPTWSSRQGGGSRRWGDLNSPATGPSRPIQPGPVGSGQRSSSRPSRRDRSSAVP
jgi:hypothetical protein